MPGLKVSPKYLYTILLACGYIYAKSSYGKFSGGTFVNGLAATLTKSAASNPYPAIKDFLNNIAIPNSYLFGTLTQWGELLTAVTLVICLPYLFFASKVNKFWYLALALGCFGAMFLNAVFWLALGYSSSSTESLNLLMFIVETVGAVFALSNYSKPLAK